MAARSIRFITDTSTPRLPCATAWGWMSSRSSLHTIRRIVWILPTKKAIAIYDGLLHTSQDVLEDVIGEVPAKDRKAVRDSVQILAAAAARVLEKDKKR